MIITITGANDYERRAALTQLVRAYESEHGAMALERLDGEEASIDRLREALQSVSFLVPEKMVVLRQPGKQKVFSETFAAILADIPDATTVVIYEPTLDKRGTYYKALKKHTDFRNFDEADAGSLQKWAVNYAKEQGGSVSPGDARVLIDRLGLNQQLLKNELDKLLLYDPAITARTIELLTEPLPQSSIFTLIEAAFKGNAAEAIRLYKEQREQKIEPQAIIALLAWQLHIIATVKSASGQPIEVIAKEAGLNPFVVRKTALLVKSLEMPRIKRLVTDLLDIDSRLKRSSIDPDQALQLYLLRIPEK